MYPVLTDNASQGIDVSVFPGEVLPPAEMEPALALPNLISPNNHRRRTKYNPIPRSKHTAPALTSFTAKRGLFPPSSRTAAQSCRVEHVRVSSSRRHVGAYGCPRTSIECIGAHKRQISYCAFFFKRFTARDITPGWLIPLGSAGVHEARFFTFRL